MNDVARLFRVLVRQLADTDPGRLHTDLQVSELYQSLVPYRQFKRQLNFDTIEDYEMAIVRLIAGEGDFVTVDPVEVQTAMQLEVDAVAPDTSAFRDYAAARISLSPRAVETVLDDDLAYAPPVEPPDQADPVQEGAKEWTEAVSPAEASELVEQTFAPPPISESAAEVPSLSEAPSPQPPEGTSAGLVFEPVEALSACPECRRSLPEGRRANFCPFCGAPVAPGACVDCGESVEPSWRFCLNCGRAISE